MLRTHLVPACVGLVLLAGAAAGCGGPDDDRDAHGSPGPDRAAVRTGLAELFAGDRPTARDTADGECFADGLLDRVTPEQLRTAGVLGPSYLVVDELPRLPEELARAWVEAQFACTDFVARAAGARDAVSHGGVDPSSFAACLRGALTDSELQAAVVDTLIGDWDGADLARLTEAQAGCAVPRP